MKILRIIARMNVGGPSLQVKTLMEGLHSPEFEQKLITGYCAPDELDFLDSFQVNFNVKKINGLGRKVNLRNELFAFRELYFAIKDFNPDIIHSHTTKAGFMARVLCTFFFPKIIRVHTFHGHLLTGYANKTYTNIYVAIERLLARSTHKLIAVGSVVRDELINKKIGDLTKFKVINPGFDFEPRMDQKRSRKKFGIDEEMFVVGFVSRLVKVKRIDRLINVIEQVIKEKSNIQFVVAGHGNLFQEIKVIESKSNGKVKLLGWVNDIENLISSFDVLILTSDNEGTPLILMQAQISGIPVVSTDVGSVKDIMLNNSTGFLVNASSDSIAAKILTLEKNRMMVEKMGRAGKAFMTQNFSKKRFLSSHTSLYNELMTLKSKVN